MPYQIFTDATADLNPALLDGCPPVGVVPMEVEVDGQAYLYGPGGTLTVPAFYEMQRAGKFASTSQINPAIYRDAFEPVLRQGVDILYLCFTSGLSGTLQAANLCAAELSAEYPERKLLCVDTLCASAGEGFLVREAALRQAAGASMEEVLDWVMERRLKVCHWFTVDTFDHLRHGGRVSAAAAVMGTMLQIKPLLHVDEAGALKVAAKPRGRTGAIHALVSRLEQGWTPELGRAVGIAHGDCPDGAEQLTAAVRAKCPDAEILPLEIGPVIGSHTGPGMLAVLYWGSNR